ncbi:MAG: pyrimidine-nucleoside phosphorylase, partial [Chloroflexi bacterium]|nr:pyrimidine-nucleoside phosphorylase [Chloroflexota bacterium]
MRVVEIIERKRDGAKLSKDEIDSIVLGFTRGDVPDGQMAAFLMAVVWRGMDDEETAL